ncbi:MAG TPA: TIGR02147 family protein, partial [Bdellovibrionales bacterium]|nr:TIGR02147 family protein [Bdellovibrionales bacterium]
MTQVTNYQDYRVYLKGVLEQRLRDNARYSLRAFARDLQVTPARLSEILNRKKGLSLEAATLMAKRLSLSEQETRFFCDLVQMADARSASAKKVAEIRIDREIQSQNFNTIQLDVFKVISDWHHFAILELTLVDGFRSDSAWIAKKLGISAHEVKAAIDRLVTLELLELKGKRLVKTDMKITT